MNHHASVSRIVIYTLLLTVTALALPASDFSPCVVKCMSQPSVGNCSTPSCACELDQQMDAVSPCLRKCNFPEVMIAKKVTSIACGTYGRRNRKKYYIDVNLGLGLVTAFITVVRLVFKRWYSESRRLGPDDWVLLLAMAFGIPCSILNLFGFHANGLGQDAWVLGVETVSRFAFWFWLLEMLYLTALTMVKLTMLTFYLTIFTSISAAPWTRKQLWASIGVNIFLNLTYLVMIICQCRPLRFFWRQYVDSMDSGMCYAEAPVMWVNASVNVALDVWMIMIPLREVYFLTMHWKKKIGVVIMFLTGACVTVVSILRLQSLIWFNKSINITWDYMGVLLWSTIEVNVGIICTNLPTIRLVLVHISPRIFGSQPPNANAAGNGPGGMQEAVDPFANLQPYVEGDEDKGFHGRLDMSNVAALNLDNVP